MQEVVAKLILNLRNTTLDNTKNELGISDYQIRKWQSWHTHHALMMLASLLITKKLIKVYRLRQRDELGMPVNTDFSKQLA